MTTENNKIIVEFMEWDILNDMTYSKATKGKWIELDKLKFHSNWNWLMEVVEKIESLGYWTELLGGCHQEFRIGKINQIKEFINKDGSDKKEAVYNTCLEFIKWYNEQNKV